MWDNNINEQHIYPLLYLPIAISTIVIFIIIANSFFKIFFEQKLNENNELIKPFYYEYGSYGSDLFDRIYSPIVHDNFFAPKLKKYQNENQLIRAIIGIINGYFRQSSIIHIIIAIVMLVLSIISHISFGIFILITIYTFFRLLHFIFCWLEIGWIKSTYLHWISFWINIFIISFTIYFLFVSFNDKNQNTQFNIIFYLAFIFVPTIVLCSSICRPIINIKRKNKFSPTHLIFVSGIGIDSTFGDFMKQNNNILVIVFGNIFNAPLTKIKINSEYYIK